MQRAKKLSAVEMANHETIAADWLARQKEFVLHSERISGEGYEPSPEATDEFV